MDQSQKVYPPDCKEEPSNEATDANPYNEPTYSRQQEGTNVAEDVRSWQTPDPEAFGFSSPLASESDPSAPISYYDMSGDKFLIIFNHYQYHKWQLTPEPSIRSGTYADVKSLKKTFDNLGFKIAPHHDCTYEEIKKHVKDMCERDHSNTSCVAVTVMTHGIDDHLCAADVKYPVTDITEPLRTVPSLAGKPKLFFIQACRNNHIETQIQQDAKTEIPMGADCLVLYSTYEDYISYRNWIKGSWMIQALCEVINTNYHSLHLTKMLTLINKKVAKKSLKDDDENICKQTPVTYCDLKKLLKFNTKEEQS